MSRVGAFLVSATAVAVLAVLGLLGLLSGGSADMFAAAPPTAPPVAPPTTTPGVPATAVPAVAVPTTLPATATTVPPAGTRGGSAAGGVAKPTHETWSPRRIAVTTILAVIALAAAGYVYGKFRSAPPRHPDLVRQPEDEMAR